MNKFGNYLWGLLFILLGVVLGINALGIMDIDIFFDGWWTLFIIIPCLINLFNDKDKIGNAIGLLIGVLLLLSCRNLIDFSLVWKLLVPAILVIIGISIIFKDGINGKVKDEIKRINSNNLNKDEYCATFGEQNIEFSDEVFKGCSLQAIFGSIKSNLENVKIKDDVVINVLSLFGSNTIIVPDNVGVIVKGTPIFGSINNHKTNSKNTDKVIYINVSCIFGGVDIK